MVARVLKAVPIAHKKKNSFFTIKAKWIMLFVEMNVAYAENHNRYSP
jgi:hypothetical protein